MSDPEELNYDWLLAWTENIGHGSRKCGIVNDGGEKKIVYYDEITDEWYMYPIEIEVDNLE